MAGFKDLTGQRFGRLTVCRRAPNVKGAKKESIGFVNAIVAEVR